MIHAAIYCRLSSDRTGAGLVVERQERDCRDLARSLGWDVARVFTDNDISAYSGRRRPGYEAMLAAIDAGEVDGVLAWHPDRLHRAPRELEGYIDACERRAVPTRTVRAGLLDLTTAAGRMVARQTGAVARYESEQIRDRTRAGKTDAAARGRWAGGQRPYGYEIVPMHERTDPDVALRPVPAEAEVVREVARRALAGESLRSIARDLNTRGLSRPRGGAWTGGDLRGVLLRPLTAGLREHRGELHRGNWEPLLGEDMWRGVCALLRNPARRTNPAGNARTYLGSGLYRCGVCGGPLTGNATASGSGRRAYRCRTADHEGRVHVVRDAATLDALVERVAVERLAQPDAVVALLPRPVDTAPLHEEAAGLRARLDELAALWAAGTVTTSQMTTASAALRERLAEVEAEVGRAAQGTALDGLVGAPEVPAVWAALPLDRRRAVIDLLMVVTVHRGRRGRPPGWVPGEPYFDPRSIEITWKQS